MNVRCDDRSVIEKLAEESLKTNFDTPKEDAEEELESSDAGGPEGGSVPVTVVYGRVEEPCQERGGAAHVSLGPQRRIVQG